MKITYATKITIATILIFIFNVSLIFFFYVPDTKVVLVDATENQIGNLYSMAEMGWE